MNRSASPRSLLVLAALVMAVAGASQWWSGHLERRTGEQVAALARPGDIRMLASESCGVCASARAWFRHHRIAYSECAIERDAACRADFEASRAAGTPVIVVRGQPQLGFSADRLLRSLQVGASRGT